MAEYYVTEGGGVGKDGTTYAKAYAASDFNANTGGFVAAGNTIYLCGIITTKLEIPVTGTSANRITLRGDYSADPGILYGPDAATVALYADDKDYITITNLSFTRALCGIHSITAPKYWNITNCSFYDLDERGMLIVGVSTGPDFADSWSIKNCTFTNIGNWTHTADADINITVAARNFIIKDCTFRGNGTSKGVDGITWSQNGATGRGSNNKVINCTFYGHGENCIDLKGVDDGATYTEIINCTMGGSDQQLVNIAYETNRVRFIGCTFYDKLVGTTNTAVSYTNPVTNCGTLIDFQGCTFENTGAQCFGNIQANWSVYNCTFRNITATSSTTYPIDVYADGFTAKNNIFDTMAGGRTEATRYTYRFATDANYTTATLDYNAYGTTSTTGKVVIHNATTKTLAEMQGSGKETHGQVVNSLLDSKLIPLSSSVQKAGVWLPNIVGFDGLPLQNPPDLGAMQNRNLSGRRSGFK